MEKRVVKPKNPSPNTPKYNEANVKDAIRRAKVRLKISQNPSWPSENGTTAVHLLVEKIFD